MTTLLAFVLTLAVLIVVHEFGHYRVARWCGVKVLRFSVGFGRPLLRWQPNPSGTEFTLSALPLGGYVKMLDSREAQVPADQLSQAFDHQPLRSRVAIVLAGPLANLGLAVVLYASANWWGLVEPQALLAEPPARSLAAESGLRAGDWVRSVSVDGSEWRDVASMSDLRWRLSQAILDQQPLLLQVTDPSGAHRRSVNLSLDRFQGREMAPADWRELGLGLPYSEPVMGEVSAGGPAAQAGLMKGDRVLSIDGQPVADAQVLRERIRASSGMSVGVMEWQIERGPQRLLLVVEPRRVTEAGQTFGRVDAFVGQPPATTLVRLGPVDGLANAAAKTWEMSWTSLRMVGRMVTGQSSLRQLSGPLTIADYAGQSAQQGLAYYLSFLALVSVSLGVLNLLPLPMLDGGHLIYYLYEGVTGRPISDLWLSWLQRGGAVVLLLMMSIALSNDVARLLGLQ